MKPKVAQSVSIALWALAGFFILIVWQGHQGLSLWDEGFLWYGAQRVLVGEVPMRDFMAYDFGRYYWSAAVMRLMGDNGIVALRVASTLFQTIALSVGGWVLARSAPKQKLFLWLLAVTTLCAWMAPQYRLFDASLPILLVGALAYLIEQPTIRRYVLCGLTVGLVAVFGKNHGVYGAAGSVGVIAYLALKRESGPGPISAFACWLSGVVVGFLPVLTFLAVVPGFARAFWESILWLFEVKGTNIPLPVPWPWRVPFGQLPTLEAMRGVATGIFFIVIVAFGVGGLCWAVLKRLRSDAASPALVASAFMTLPYAHYAYSRADLAHLTPGIPPFLMGAFALFSIQPAKLKWPLAALLCGGSLLVMLPTHPRWDCAVESDKPCVDVKIGQDLIRMDAVTAGNLSILGELAEQFARGDRTFIAAPFWPGAYAVFGRKSPMWEIYGLFPRTPAFQQAEIARIKTADPGFVVIYDRALDERDELRFRNTHPIIDQYIRDNFERLDEYSQNPSFQVYRSRRSG